MYYIVPGIKNIGFAFIYLLISIIKVITFGKIGKYWGVILAIKELNNRPEYDD